MSTATIPMTASLPGWEGLRAWIRTAGHCSLIGLGAAIPLSTSAAEILVAAYAACWLLSGDCLSLVESVRKHRVAAACVGMFGVLLIGATYGPSSVRDLLKTLAKYREFLYVPLFFPAFQEERVRRWAMRAFLAGVTVMLALSYAEWLFRFDIGLLSSTDFVIGRDRIIHGLLVAFAMFLVAQRAWDEPHGRWWRLLFLAAAVFNILVLVQGRTGHLVMSLLGLLFMFQRMQWRGLLLGGVLLAAFWGTVYKVSPIVQKRIQFTVVQLNDQFGALKKRNDDARLEFYEYTLQIIRQNPLSGAGTGGFLHAYREIARHNGVPATEDPHSEYLLLAVQLGVFGPVSFLALLGICWFATRGLPVGDGRVAQGLLVTIGAGCVVNSLMYGFTGGLLFGYVVAMAFAAGPARAAVGAEMGQVIAPRMAA